MDSPFQPSPLPVIPYTWYSPLPPQPGGVSTHAASLLVRRPPCDLALVTGTTAGESWPELATLPRITPADAAARDAAGGYPLYQMSNHLEQSAASLDALRRVPGLTTIHDINIHGLLLDHLFRSRQKKFRLLPRRRDEIEADPYYLALVDAHGEAGGRVANALLTAGTLPDIPSYPCHRLLTKSSHAIIAHSHWALRELAANGDPCELHHLPLGVEYPASGSPEGARQTRAAAGIPADGFLAVCAGFLEPNRRLDSVIQALASLRGRGLNIHLALAGSIDRNHAIWLRDTAAAAGVGDLVHFAGFVPDHAEFMNWIRASDVLVHLRHPTNGENSSTLLRALAVGRPVIASACDSYAELPDNCVWKVDVGPVEIPLLAEYLWELHRRPEIRAAMRERGENLVRTTHQYDVVARGFWDIAADVATRHAGSAALQTDQVHHRAQTPRIG